MLRSRRNLDLIRKTLSIRCMSDSKGCVVNSFNEFDPLEEIIVGRVEGASIPEWHVAGKAVWPDEWWNLYKTKAGQPFPAHITKNAIAELENFVKILEAEGVTVRRPDNPGEDFFKPFQTPDFKTHCGSYAAMPRDILMVVGNEIIEAPMSWRSRFFEYRPYRRLVKEYFNQGAKWTAAPKPQMSDELYVPESEFKEGVPGSFVLTEFEPAFDVADFTRIGRDIFAQRSNVTNRFGIDWMRRHLGEQYTIHELDFRDAWSMHIDCSFVPLAPGKVLVNPERPPHNGKEVQKTFTYEGTKKEVRLPEMFRGWDIFLAPPSQLPLSTNEFPLYFTSPWIATCNILMLDHKRVIVESHETEAIKLFKEWGFTPIPVPFRNFFSFGGSFHCATCDVRRRGQLQSYF